MEQNKKQPQGTLKCNYMKICENSRYIRDKPKYTYPVQHLHGFGQINIS